jgi:hypothetical protein
VLREWILGWDRDRSTAASSGDRALRPKASIRGIAASSSGAIFGLRLCGFDIGRQLAPFFTVTQLVARLELGMVKGMLREGPRDAMGRAARLPTRESRAKVAGRYPPTNATVLAPEAAVFRGCAGRGERRGR